MRSQTALAVSIAIGVVGQLSLKAGAAKGFKGLLPQDPFIVLGLAAYFGAALLYVYALRTIPLSVAFPTVAISYVAVSLLAHLVWGEAFGVRQIVALVLITAGIFVLSTG